jgi:hypothetical protein
MTFSIYLKLINPNLDLARYKLTLKPEDKLATAMVVSKFVPFKPVKCSMIIWVRRAQVYKTSFEIEYGITSLSRKHAPAIKVLKVRRSHWSIETGLHYRRDVTFHEDATRMTIGASGNILSVVHNLVLGLLKRAGFVNSAKGRRWFEGHVQDAFALLISGNSFS